VTGLLNLYDATAHGANGLETAGNQPRLIERKRAESSKRLLSNILAPTIASAASSGQNHDVETIVMPSTALTAR
jgi:hypothetical protein